MYLFDLIISLSLNVQVLFHICKNCTFSDSNIIKLHKYVI